MIFLRISVLTSIIVCALLLAFTSPQRSNTYYVPDDYRTIQEAIDATIHGDTVIVRPGTYVENIRFHGKAITVKSELGPYVTLIDGNQMESCVSFLDGEHNTSILEGFTITNGLGTYDPWIYGHFGGGIICMNSSSPLIRNNIISKNTPLYGGGIHVEHFSSPVIERNIITENSVGLGYGGGIYCFGSCSPVIKGNYISKNSAWLGGGIYCKARGSPVIRDNVITKNVANNNGGGIYARELYLSTNFLLIANNIVSENTAEKHGGGIDCVDVNELIITSNTIFGNKSGYSGGGGGGFRCQLIDKGEIANTILWNNKPYEIVLYSTGTPFVISVSYTDVEGGMKKVKLDPGCTLNWGAGMIDADPLFVASAEGDLHIRHDSPCKDAGDDAAPHLSDIDFEGDPRIADGKTDMGADEFHAHLYCTGNAKPSGKVKVKFIGTPSTSPVGLFLGSGVMDPPLASPWGDWYLEFPVFGPFLLAPIPFPEGVEVLYGTLPAAPPGPYSIPMQALIGNEFTNPCILFVE